LARIENRLIQHDKFAFISPSQFVSFRFSLDLMYINRSLFYSSLRVSLFSFFFIIPNNSIG